VDSDDIRWARPQVNLSESLGRVPGIVVQNRHNYAQDLQISSRGFGARSTFGVRGLRLIADGIPASFPDGQGQVSHFDLGSADSIEVLRGPFALMYGNASGGVINLVTESGARYGEGKTAAGADFALGSYGAWRAGFKAGGRQGRADWMLSTSHFHTGGYRDHSDADRGQINAKVGIALDGGSSLTLVANSFSSPDTQDPLGLTRAQMDANPRQAVANAYLFDTRKTANQTQVGAAYMRRLSEWTLNAAAYTGHRDIRQYLAIPLMNQADVRHSGGVVDLDRDFGGLSLRFSREATLLGKPLSINIGGEYESYVERRKGFENLLGHIGAMKRDEDDTVSSRGVYAQGEWRFAERWIALAAIRSSRVEFRVQDYFIVPATLNLDDSGRKRYQAVTPVAGILYKVAPDVSTYVTAGSGFETPTFAEIAYASNTGSGPNFNLEASSSRHLEMGVKALIAGRVRVNAALFGIDTRDEIAIASNSFGRSTFQNVGRTNRKGLELGANANLPHGFEALLAWTRLEAKFLDSFKSVAGAPAVPVTVAAGNYLPGVPRSTLYAELRWHHAPTGFTTALEFQHKSRVWVDDRNSEAADASNVTNIAAGFEQRSGNWRFTEYARIDNATNRRYAGSVVVNDGNLRFYEPAPGRNYIIGAMAKLGF